MCALRVRPNPSLPGRLVDTRAALENNDAGKAMVRLRQAVIPRAPAHLQPHGQAVIQAGSIADRSATKRALSTLGLWLERAARATHIAQVLDDPAQ